MKINDISGFTFFRSYYESICTLEPEDKRDILEAIVDFMYLDKEPELDGFKNSIWTLIKPNLISSKNRSSKYQEEIKNKSKVKQKKTKKKSKKDETEIDEELDLNDSPPKDKERKEEKKERKEKEKEEEVYGTTTTNSNYLEEQFGRKLSPSEIDSLKYWDEVFTEDIIQHAIYIAVMQNKKKMSYINGILKNWQTCGYSTLSEIKDSEDDFYSDSSSVYEDFDWLNGGE